MPQNLASLVRAKHPGAYDDMDDVSLESAVRAKYPGVYDDIPSANAPKPSERGVPAAGNTFSDKLASAADYLGQVKDRFVGSVGHVAKEPAVGATLAAATAAPFTGGLSLLPAAATMFAAGTAGAAPAAIAKGEPEEALTQGAYAAAGEGVMRGAQAVPGLARGAAAMAGKLPIGKIGSVAADLATEALPFGRVARKVLSYALDAAKSAKLPPSAMVSGRIVPAQSQTLAEVLTDALAETRASGMPRITTPPEPSLPAGYTPRTTVPKPRAVKMSGPTAAPVAEPPAQPKRAYFLKSEADLAPVESPPATGTIDPSELPASWQQHIGQDLFPLTGKEGAEVVTALADELRGSGMSVGQAMMAVSKNPDIPVQFRQQLLKSLSRIKMKGGS